MTIEEVREAVSLDESQTTYDPSKLPSEQVLLEACEGLVEKDSGGIMKFIHATIQEFFDRTSTRGMHSSDLMSEVFTGREARNLKLARACLTYLKFEHFNAGKASSAEGLGQRFSNFKFLKYAAQSIGDHLRNSSQDGCRDGWRALMALSGPKVQSWLQAYYYDADPERGNRTFLPVRFPFDQIPSFSPSTWQSLLPVVHGLEVVLDDLKLNADSLDPRLLLVSSNDYTMLHHALAWRRTSIAAKLVPLMDEKSLNRMTDSGCTAVNIAALQGLTQLVQQLAQRGVDLLRTEWPTAAPLYNAVNAGYYDAAQVLLDYGAPPNQKSGEKLMTALAVFSYKPWTDFTEKLLDSGASVSEKGEDGTTFLHLLCASGNKDKISRSLRGMSRDQIDYALTQGATDLDMVPLLFVSTEEARQYLLSFEVMGPGYRNKYGWNLLELGIAGDDLDLIKTMLCNGKYQACLDAHDCDGYEPVFLLWPEDDLAFMEDLINRNFNDFARTSLGDTDVPEGYKKTPVLFDSLNLAVENSSMLEILLSHGAAANGVDGFTRPLTTACSKRNLESAKLLLKHGADPNASNEDGTCTVMHTAALTSTPDILEFLLQNGGKWDQVGLDGFAPISFCSTIANLDVLLAHGADICFPNPEHITPMVVAFLTNNMDLLKYIHGRMPLRVGEPDFFTIPLLHAITQGKHEFVDYVLPLSDLRENVLDQPVLTHIATDGKDESAIRKALAVCKDQELDIEVREASSKYTPLMTAFSFCNLTAFKALLEIGADADARYPKMENVTRGTSVLMRCSRAAKFTPFLDELLKRPDVERLLAARNKVGSTALHYHVAVPDNMRKLIAAGADVNAVSSDKNFTPLHMAALGPQMDTVAKGTTTTEAYIESFQLLLDAGAKTDIEDSQGNSPVAYTRETFGWKWFLSLVWKIHTRDLRKWQVSLVKIGAVGITGFSTWLLIFILRSLARRVLQLRLRPGWLRRGLRDKS